MMDIDWIQARCAGFYDKVGVGGQARRAPTDVHLRLRVFLEMKTRKNAP